MQAMGLRIAEREHRSVRVQLQGTAILLEFGHRVQMTEEQYIIILNRASLKAPRQSRKGTLIA